MAAAPLPRQLLHGWSSSDLPVLMVMEGIWQWVTDNLPVGMILFIVIALVRDTKRGDVGSDTGELEFDDPENISPADRVRKIQDDPGNPLK